jgi:hypothetical protein
MLNNYPIVPNPSCHMQVPKAKKVENNWGGKNGRKGASPSDVFAIAPKRGKIISAALNRTDATGQSRTLLRNESHEILRITANLAVP